VIVPFLAVILTGLAVIAPAAHLLEMSRKMRLPMERYFVVQDIYLGWWMAGLFLPAAGLANIAFAIMTGSGFAVAATVLIAVNLTIFLIWTQPVNRVTQNWTIQRDDWRALRNQWEYSHAVNAGVTFLAFCAATLAALKA
jgi:hypothetical protein